MATTSDSLPVPRPTIPHARWLLAATAVGLLSVAIAFAALAIRRSQQRLSESLSTTIAFSQNVDLARDAQVHFKREVQEWKDVLLRGHEPSDYAKYWSLFEKEEATTEALLREIKRRDPGEATAIDGLIANLQGIGQRYRTAIRRLNADDPLSHRVVDREVRGMDRPLTDQMSAQVARLQQRMSALGTQMSVTHQAEMSRMRVAVMAAAVLGMLSMVMLMLLVRRAERERAEASAKAKSAFLATMSHEIRTPMNAVLGMANLLQHTSLTATQSDYLAKLQAASRHLLGIIDDVLDLSKIEASRLELEHLVFSLDDVLDDVATLVGARASEKGIELILARESNVPVLLLGDPLRLGQVVSNLASNAVKFTEKGEVRISVSEHGWDGDRVKLHFEVIDTGIGLSTEQQARLFQPFAQADGSTTRRFGGTGLGLAICARLVKMMGGRIGVESAVGRGSRFFFTVPLRSRRDDRRKQPGVPPELRSRHIVVGVENQSMRATIAQTLLGAGLSVTSAGDVPAVRALLATPETRPDLAVLDWRLNPGGIAELLALARDEGWIPGERLLVLASQTDAEESHAALRTLGLGVLVIKPASPSTLFETVARAFGLEQRDRNKRGSVCRPKASEHSWRRLKGLPVLLVEDNAINQEVAAATLGLAGVSVTVVSNGSAAVDAVARSWDTGRPFALVLMDRHMPGMDGLATTRRIRLDPRAASLPIVAMTADVVGASREECLAAGMNDFISKPFAADTLVDVIARWVREDRASGSQELWTLPTSLPGIDVATGLGYVAGELSVYSSLLLRFRKDYAHADRHVEELLAQGDLTSAERFAHSLKGLAGQIGARELQSNAAELHAAIKRGADDLSGPIRGVAASLAEVIEGLAQLQEPVHARGHGSEGAAVLVEQVSALVLANDPDARQAAGRLREALSGSVRSQADALVRYLDQYDFDGARQVLSGILDTVKSQEAAR
jgi:two-component system, sensor histidine kinase and response regulator